MLNCVSLTAFMSVCQLTARIGSMNGRIETTANGTRFASFLGIRYAQKSFGESRFLEPYPVVQNINIGRRVDCIEVNPIDGVLIGEEDCLFLNVFAPLPKNKKIMPVMIWIHGRAFPLRTNRGSIYTPKPLMDHDVIVVTFTYRLGPLSFDHWRDPLLDLGVKDQQMAIKWVIKNIHLFGGDREKITLAGESGGAAYALHHVNGYFNGKVNRGIALSGFRFSQWALTRMRWTKDQSQELFDSLKCNNVECMREKKAEEIVKSSYEYNKKHMWLWYNTFNAFKPGMNMSDLNDEPWVKNKENANYALLLGLRRYEGDIIQEFSDRYNTSEDELGRYYCTYARYAVKYEKKARSRCYFHPSYYITARYKADTDPTSSLKDYVEDGWALFPATLEATFHRGHYEAFMYDFRMCKSKPNCTLQCKLPFMEVQDGCPPYDHAYASIASQFTNVIADFVNERNLDVKFFLDDNYFFNITPALVDPEEYSYYFISEQLSMRMNAWKKIYWSLLPSEWTKGNVGASQSSSQTVSVQKIDNVSLVSTRGKFKELLEKGGQTIDLIYNCAVEFEETKISQIYDFFAKELKQFKDELELLEWEEAHEVLREFNSNLWYKLEPHNLDDAVEQYFTIFHFFANALDSNVKKNEELASKLWTMVRKFATKPLESVGIISAELKDQLQQFTLRPSSNSTRSFFQLREKFENEMDYCRKEIEYYHTCAKTIDEDRKGDVINVIFYKLYHLKKDLDTLVDNKSMPLLRQINTEVWMSKPSMVDVDMAFQKYQILYNHFNNQVRMKLKSDKELSSPYWERIMKFLQDPFYFSFDVTGFEVDPCTYGNPLECLKSQIQKRRTLANAYYECSLLFDRKKQRGIANNIGECLQSLKAELEKIYPGETERNRALYVSLKGQFIFTAYELTAAFRKYDNLLNFLEIMILDNLTSVDSPFWKEVKNFVNSPFEFSVLSNKTADKFVQLMKAKDDKYEVPIPPRKKDLHKKIWKRTMLVKTYHACVDEMDEDMKFNLTNSINAQLNFLRKHVAWANTLEYAMPRLGPFINKPLTDSGLTIEEILESYEDLLKYFSKMLQNERTLPVAISQGYWANTEEFWTKPFF